MRDSTRQVLEALKVMGKEVITGKGGFFIRNEGFITLAAARRLTGINAPTRQRRERVTAYGDWAMVAAINGRLKG